MPKTVFSRSRDQCAANWCTNFNCSLGLGFGDGLGLWLSSGHLLLSGDGLGLGFWVVDLDCRGDTRPARGSKLTLLSQLER